MTRVFIAFIFIVITVSPRLNASRVQTFLIAKLFRILNTFFITVLVCISTSSVLYLSSEIPFLQMKLKGEYLNICISTILVIIAVIAHTLFSTISKHSFCTALATATLKVIPITSFSQTNLITYFIPYHICKTPTSTVTTISIIIITVSVITLRLTS